MAVLVATGLSHTQPETIIVLGSILITSTHVLNTNTD